MTENFYSVDPASGTERLLELTCKVCGKPRLNRTGLCDACQLKCMELGKSILIREARGDVVFCKDCVYAPEDVMKPMAGCLNKIFASINYRDGAISCPSCSTQNHDGKCVGYLGKVTP